MPEMQRYYLTPEVGEDVSDIVPITANDMYPNEFPGYVGVSLENLPSDAFIPHNLYVPDSMDAAGQHIDYTSYGESGEVNRNSYAIGGPVEPNLVENFALTGSVLPGQRRPEYSDGHVSEYDHNAYTALQIAQQMAPEAYAEQSIANLVMGY